MLDKYNHTRFKELFIGLQKQVFYLVHNEFPNFPIGFLEVLVGKPESLYWESDT